MLLRPDQQDAKRRSKREWYLKNREHALAYAKQYLGTHPRDKDQQRAKNKAKYQILKSDPEYVAQHRARNREYCRFRRQDPEIKRRDRESTKRARQRNVLPFLIRAARNRAIKKGLQFDLTVEWAASVWTGRCCLTDIEFVVGDGCQRSRSPSLDRIDPERGYVEDNCRFVLSAVNSLKGVSTDDEMYVVAEALIGRRA